LLRARGVTAAMERLRLLKNDIHSFVLSFFLYIYIVSSSVRTTIVKVNGVLTLLLEIDFLLVETVTLDG